jgi:hypothetical protein
VPTCIKIASNPFSSPDLSPASSDIVA